MIMINTRYFYARGKRQMPVFLLLSLLFLWSFGSCSTSSGSDGEIRGAPQGLRVYADSQTVMILSWEAVPGASEYVVYRSLRADDPVGNPAGDPYEEIGRSNTPSFRDTGLIANTFYYYKVGASNSSGSGEVSTVVRGRTPDNDDSVFWAVDLTGPEKYYKTWARLLTTGDHCVVYGEIPGYTINSPLIAPEAANEMADEFKNIYKKITEVFGKPRDTEGNGKVTLLLLDIQDGYDGNPDTPYAAGFFSSQRYVYGSVFQSQGYAIH